MMRVRGLSVTVLLIVLVLVFSGCGMRLISRDTGPEIAFRQYSGEMTASTQPRAQYWYFEVTRGPGQVEITMDMYGPHGFHDSATSNFEVEEGTYRLMVEIDGLTGGLTVHDTSRFDAEFVLKSPSASAEERRRTMVWGRFHKDISMGSMSVEPWVPSSPGP